jgi:hypothetical protein
MADDSHSVTTPYVQLNTLHVSSPPNETTYRKAVNEIRSKIKNASGGSVHIYSFNVHSEQLESAHTLLNKEEERKSMRVTYSDDYNFIVRYMPSRAHEVAHVYWTTSLFIALLQLTPPPHAAMPPGCIGIASTTFQLGSRKKQADAGVEPDPNPSGLPSIVLEVGSSESLTQLKIDARLWLEHVPEIQLVILLSIDPPIAPHPNLPRIAIQLWRSFTLNHTPRTPTARQREARMVWESDWTHTATPLYILLSDIFRGGPVPADYGNNDRVHLETAAWRQAIISRYP